MMLFDALSTYVSKPGRFSRRSFFGRTVKVAAGLAALAAGLPMATARATACWGSDPCGGSHNAACCCLAYPNNECNSDFYDGICPCDTGQSCNPWEWVCYVGSCPWVCGECYPCSCSYAYAACGSGCPCSPQAPTLSTKLGQWRHARATARPSVGGAWAR